MKLTTKTLKRLIKEELSKMNEEEMVNEAIGPDKNISLKELKQKVITIAGGVTDNPWIAKLINIKNFSGGYDLDYLDWIDALEGDGKLYVNDRLVKFAPNDRGYARSVHKKAIQQLTAEKKKQKELPMSESK